MGISILKIENLTKSYGKTKAISNISLWLDEGEIFGFIGPNGAGKSTTIRSIMNLINKDSGSISIYGKEFEKSDIETKAKIGYLPSEINLYEDATVKQILDFHEKFYNYHLFFAFGNRSNSHHAIFYWQFFAIYSR